MNNIQLIPGLTNCIIHVEGPDDDRNLFFQCVSSNKLSSVGSDQYNYYDDFQIGSFSPTNAIEFLIIKNEGYKKIFIEKINGFESYDIPKIYSTKITTNKFNGSDIMMLVDFKHYRYGYKKAHKKLMQLMGAFSVEFPSLTFYIGFNNVGRKYADTNEKINVRKLYMDNNSSEVFNHRPNSHFIAIHSEIPIKYTMMFIVIHKSKMTNSKGVFSVTSHKQMTITL